VSEDEIITFEEIDGYEVNAIIASSSTGKRLSYVFNVNDAVGWYVVTVNGTETYRTAAYSRGVHDAIEAYNTRR